jgi:hypothetical protein
MFCAARSKTFSRAKNRPVAVQYCARDFLPSTNQAGFAENSRSFAASAKCFVAAHKGVMSAAPGKPILRH